ncbi:signal recognition particle 14kD protein [Xylariaceae sp. FL0804]|nr:signal recognition particle 14kD protein [Xylariaceae sp. FL0804]
MEKAHLSNAEFFTKLSELFDSQKGKDHGSIVLTQKRLTRDEHTSAPTTATATADDDEDLQQQPTPVLIRASNAKGKEARRAGRKVRLATVVAPDALPAFFERYADACKAGMAALKPRDRSRRKGKARKKNKGTAAAS